MTTAISRLVLDDNPQLDDALILRLMHDLASGMHNAEVIAQRYGLRDAQELREYLRDHPTLVAEAAKMKAMFLSEDATEARIRAKFMRATEQLIIPMTALVADPRTPVTSRIDGFKQIQRGAGVDGAPAAARDGKSGPGTQFSLTINFAGGRAETFEGVTLENDVPSAALPVVSSALGLGAEADDAEYDEEV